MKKKYTKNLVKTLKNKLQSKRKFFSFILAFLAIIPLNAQLTVSVNTSWDPVGNPPPIGYEQGIKVTNGATLTIINLNLIFVPSAEIRIEESSLIIDGSTLEMGQDAAIILDNPCGNVLEIYGTTLNSSPGVTWKGISIDLNGCGAHGIQSQFAVEPLIGNDGTCTPAEWEGVLSSSVSKIIANDSYFENAEVAINSDGDHNYFTGGGIVRVRRCSFLNCEKGVRVAGWNRKNPNASYIMTSDFTWDDNLLFGKSNLTHVEFVDLGISAVNVGGCNFYNEINSQDPASQRGIGINAINSDFSTSKDGDQCCAEGNECPDNCFSNPTTTSRRNEFKLLGKGIKFGGGTSYGGNIMACRFSDFINCMNGIDADACLDGVVGRNTFTILKADIDTYYPSGTSTSTGIIDVKVNASSGIRIYRNNFDADLEYIVGVRFEAPDLTQTSFIRRNNFTSTFTLNQLCGPEVRAIDLYGNNNHLDITCNKFVEQVYDVHLDDAATLDDLPDIKVQSGNKKYNRNEWSQVTPSNNPTIPNFKWKTLGCASNMFSEVSSVTVYDRYLQIGTDNMRFEEFSYPQFNPASSSGFSIGSCPSSLNDDSDPDCVNCNTDCEQLKTNKVETGGISKLRAYQNGYIKVYPNPSNGQFTVSLINNEFGNEPKLKIFNAYGQMVYLQDMEKRSMTLSTETINIDSGIYFIRVDGNQVISTLKLIIQ